jgi:hypothetical protein
LVAPTLIVHPHTVEPFLLLAIPAVLLLPLLLLLLLASLLGSELRLSSLFGLTLDCKLLFSLVLLLAQ